MKKGMKQFLMTLVVVFFGFWGSVSTVCAQRSEEIVSFHSDITVNQDTSITIREEIKYTTILDKHGIYRYVPVSYNKNGVKEKLRISQVSVSNDAGQKIQFTRSYDGPNLVLKIGDPEKTFTGDQTYVITYTVERAVSQFDEHAELYWDITGEGWKVSVASVSATITSEYATIAEADCFSGAFGTNDGLCESSHQAKTATFVYPETIEFGDNMTVALRFPLQNQLQFPTQQELLILWFRYNWTLFLLPLPLLVSIFLWNKNGRDLQFVSQNVFDMDPDKPIQKRPLTLRAREPFVYEPLKALTPGEAGALIDGKIHVQDIVAEILELVRKNYIKIELVETKKFFTTKRDYKFTKLKEVDSSLPAVQAYLFSQLFKKKSEVLVSKLKGTFYTAMSTAQELIQDSLMKKGVYSRRPNRARSQGIGIHLALLMAVVVIVSMQYAEVDVFLPVFLVVLQAPLGLFFAHQMSQKTAVGTNLWLQSRGLKKTIAYGKWREEIKEKKLFIEEVLPFAVALGVVDRLSKDMKDLDLAPPEYLPVSGLTTWTAHEFVSGFSKEVGSGLSYNPSSSSMGGSSFSGGGSSGGGGGGGGGGSW